MEIAFDAIGLEVPNENAVEDLAADVGARGEVSVLARKDGVLHGRCLKIGAGLEVWTQIYESGKGEIVYTECRPAFRARYALKISPWELTESGKDGKSVVSGFVESTNSEILFQLQNLTEVGADVLEQTTISVGLCGLAYRAGIFPTNDDASWKTYEAAEVKVADQENFWNVAGRILAFDSLRNPQSGSDLYWIYVGMGSLNLEILVNQRSMRGKKPRVGAFIQADVWLQGHILNQTAKRNGYEGVDWSTRPADFWKSLRKPN